jgi:hypothetical protein
MIPRGWTGSHDGWDTAGAWASGVELSEAEFLGFVSVVVCDKIDSTKGAEWSSTPSEGYIALRLRFRDPDDGEFRAALSWVLYIDGSPADEPLAIVDETTEEHESGRAGQGKSLTAWLVWQTPRIGRLVLEYEPDRTPLFTFVVRGN